MLAKMVFGCEAVASVGFSWRGGDRPVRLIVLIARTSAPTEAGVSAEQQRIEPSREQANARATGC